jgi:hypothetical protein
MRMIILLTEEEQMSVSKKILVDMEAHILIKLGFDLNFPGPMQFVERYLRVLKVLYEPPVYNIAYAICKLCLVDARFLNYKPSVIAACAVMIGVNIQKKECKALTFFQFHRGKPMFNFSIWNKEVQSTTGYSFEDLKGCCSEMILYLVAYSYFQIKQFEINFAS